MDKFVKINQILCTKFDELFLPKHFMVDGLKDFQIIAMSYIDDNQTIIDIGGGKIPFVDYETKKQKKLKIIGLDISKEELDLAPEGIYDEKIINSIENFLPKDPFADLAICEAVLEHVIDNKKSIVSISKSINKNGRVLLFVPCRNAIFAKLNILIPEKLKKKVLYFIFPESKHGQGFPAFYNMCTPKDIKKICDENNLVIEKIKTYYFVSYFSFFLPIHMTWRIVQAVLILFFGKNACEAFTVVARKA